ncbi:GGDEF domain-containing protein [Marinobacter lipolyticus]|uniref:GGDEF domain-containing protein n=1 Tax=Marinobacter lipolyticus TaxID=209639 RepID=UPI001BCA7F07|nr:GGDEF domain-containing protein [Marinobacter lipolyticus]MBS8240178.1 GGDEF domain-containing protein [Marinobacter lipolyticus]
MLYRLKTDFRLSIITLLGASAVLGITPFAFMRFLQGNVVAGIVDTAILLGITGTLAYAWITGDTRRSGLFLAIICCSGAVVVGAVVGEPGLFWLYPCLVTSFFLTGPKTAAFINVAAVVALMVHGVAFSSDLQMWSFAATAFVVSACAYVFAYRNDDQRRRLEHLATIDPLTGVKNRRSMDEELQLAVYSAERNRVPCGLALLDIDHFKRINDTYGHGVGDQVLSELVAMIEQNTRKTDQLFRYGGEEFVLLLPGVDDTGLRAVVHNLQQVLRKYMHCPGGPVTVSFGVASLQADDSVDSWLQRADAALYRAKETGRDKVVFSEPQDIRESVTGVA